MREFQQSAVYAWENKVIAPLDKTHVPFNQIESIVNYIWKMEGLCFPPKVEELPKQSRKVCARGCRTVVKFPKTGTYTWIIAHELSHVQTCDMDGKSNLHGALFLGIYLQLLGRYLKLDVVELAHSADAAGLEFNLEAKSVFI